MEKHGIVLYDNSIIVDSIGASLKQSPQFEMIPILPVKQHGLEALEPNAMPFDLESPLPEAAFAMLEKRPYMTLIGISPDSNMVRVWSGQKLKEISTRELMEVIIGKNYLSIGGTE